MSDKYLSINKLRLFAIALFLLTISVAVFILTSQNADLLNTPAIEIKNNDLVLTEEEQTYLAQHPIIKLANDPEWEPFEFIDGDGQFRGIAADYAQLFEQQLGVKFEVLKDKKWAELLDSVRSGERPLVMARHATNERKQYMNFTKPYLYFPVVIVSKEGQDYVDSPERLNGLTVAGVKGFNAAIHLREHYPKIQMLYVDSIQEGLAAVITGKAYAFVANLGSVNYAIKMHGLDGLQIIGHTNLNAELAIGVHKNEPILFSIMQKALDNVSAEQASAIYDRWFQLRTVNQLDQKQIWKIVGYSLVVVIVLVAWILLFRYQRNKKQVYIDQINEYSYASLIDFSTKRIAWASNAYTKLVGCESSELIGKNFMEMASENFSTDKIMLIEKMLSMGQSWTGPVEGRGCGGNVYWVLLTLMPQKDWRGRVKQIWASRVDISDKMRIEQLLIIDELTGLYNRRHFNDVIQKEINRAKREQRSIAMASIDIDYFKRINDTYGHQQGDQALIALAKLMKERFNRANDFSFRLGGEEFLLLSHFSDKQSFVDYLECFRQAVIALNIPNEKSLPLGVMSISIGGCIWQPHDLTTEDDLFQTVDQCLYQAKEQGRNRLVMCLDQPSGLYDD
jgi:diguanylate cyclase (GGDEF)-like protein/PAS domain S-box-containing protein